VRLVPKNPRPNISYEEWDGLLRVCFVRKNRTLRAGFLGTVSVLDMLESNYRTWCATNNIALEDGPVEAGDVLMEVENTPVETGAEAEEEWDGFMDVDDEDDIPEFFKEQFKPIPKTASRKIKSKVANMIREKVRKVLEDTTQLADRRARMCDEGDFLKLLWAFNQEGIHFS